MIDKRLTEDRKYTHAEFDQLMQEIDCKIEYHAGRIQIAEVEHPNHNKIPPNVSVLLRKSLDENKYFPFGGGQGIAIEKYDRYLFPDISVSCVEEKFVRDLYLENPVAIIEVSSKATVARDTGEKMLYYFSIASLNEYVIISSTKPLVIVYSKKGDEWITTIFAGLKNKIHLPNLNLDIEMKDIYRRVKDLEKIK
jgi:Uma2 family endonuclease